MSPTSLSLLERLRLSRPDDGAWERLHELYLPLIRRWVQNAPGLGPGDVEDVVQDVFVVVHREVGGFERRRTGSFRAWLKAIAVNRIRAARRQRRPLAAAGPDAEPFLRQLEDPSSALSRRWDEEHDRHVLQKLLLLVEKDFDPATWEAFRRFFLDDRPAAAVAAELGLSENAVFCAKSRVLKRLREESAGLLD